MPAPRQPARRTTSTNASASAARTSAAKRPEPGTPALTGPRSIVLWPAPVLLAKAQPVARIDAAIRDLVTDMVRVMRLEEGAGLAAPQVGESLRIFVVEERDAEDGRPPEPLGVYINPAIVSMEGPVEPYEEGCLSLPNIRADIRRPPVVTIRATDLDGREFTRTDDAMLARIWQHEFDHLEGVLILDRMMPMDRLATRKKVKELREAYEE
ncbi:MAG: peptide deformylase [Phycisphaerae bacterium]|nr:peptide deformylase [Phycisphaerae bacterium]